MSMPHVGCLGGSVNYLRVSITDRCNLRCGYCMPEEGVRLRRREEILSYEQIVRLVHVATGIGITKVRLTGGEPLLRRGVVGLVRELAQLPGIEELTLTTNGTLLAQQATALAAAGLSRVNVSLDTLNQDRFRTITNREQVRLADVLNGISAAQEAGLAPVKINMVVLRAVNDDEVVEFARRTRTDGWHVRFIEIMPFRSCAHRPDELFVPASETQHRIEAALAPLEPACVTGNGPARYHRLPGATGTIGFINPLSADLCSRCNRLRLTADGRLLPCLLSDREINLRAALGPGRPDDQLRDLLLQGIAAKPAGHRIGERMRDRTIPPRRLMSQIGG